MDFEMGEADGGAVEVDFLCVEVDLDYEFDAARFFDFCRAESDMEFREAELWFESAGSYPPSRTFSLISIPLSKTLAFFLI